MKFLALISFACASLATVSTADAQTRNSWGGVYSSSDREVISELYLLDDKTFCLAFEGGSASLRWAGRWRERASDRVELEELLPNVPPFPITAKKAEAQQEFQLSFDGYSVSSENRIVFDWVSDGSAPNLRPLFASDQSSFSLDYEQKFPSNKSAKLYLGYLIAGHSQNEKKAKFKVFEFAVGESAFNAFTIHFAPKQTQPATKFVGTLKNGVVQLEDSQRSGGKFRNRQAIPEELLETVKSECIDPVVKQQSLPVSKDRGWLTSTRSFEVEIDLTTKKPVFPEKK